MPLCSLNENRLNVAYRKISNFPYLIVCYRRKTIFAFQSINPFRNKIITFCINAIFDYYLLIPYTYPVACILDISCNHAITLVYLLYSIYDALLFPIFRTLYLMIRRWLKHAYPTFMELRSPNGYGTTPTC